MFYARLTPSEREEMAIGRAAHRTCASNCVGPSTAPSMGADNSLTERRLRSGPPKSKTAASPAIGKPIW